jgi:hypothetical protein
MILKQNTQLVLKVLYKKIKLFVINKLTGIFFIETQGSSVQLTSQKTFVKIFTEWYHPIKIEIYMPPKNVSGDSNRQKVITIPGRLQHGKLHGMVLVYGVLSSDPQSLCSTTLFEGLQFVGHYNLGQPRGVCWKRLIGDSWIYGEVDSKGEFTGNSKVL